ncbi:MAG: sensor histidine kinase [Fimbriimonadales bacterium]
MSVREPARRFELFHERILSEKVAIVRLLLAIADLAVIALGYGVPTGSTPVALVAALLFVVYAALSWYAVRSERVQLDYYQLVSPIFDILMASLLVVVTGGFNSPFNLWFLFAVVGTGLSRFRYLPVATMAAAIVAQYLITRLPQPQPVDTEAFIAGTVSRFALAAVIAFISAYLTNLSKTLALMEQTGNLLGNTVTERDASRVFLWQTATLIDLSYGKVSIVEGTMFEVGTVATETGVPRRTWQITLGSEIFGDLVGERPQQFSQKDDTLVEIMCERAASALARIRMADDLISAAASEERERIADELHDTYLQTLAALDMRAEAARHVRSHKALEAELLDIKRIAREAAAQARQVIQRVTPRLPLGRERIERIVTERWKGEWQIKVSDDISLSVGQWRSLEMMLREGLNNARKHGKATRVVFTVEQVGEKLTAKLEDNGKGAGEVIALGYGLQRLRSILNEQGGMLHLENREYRGTALIAEIWMGAKSS